MQNLNAMQNASAIYEQNFSQKGRESIFDSKLPNSKVNISRLFFLLLLPAFSRVSELNLHLENIAVDFQQVLCSKCNKSNKNKHS